MDCSLPDSSVHGIFQARVLEWVASVCVYAYKWKTHHGGLDGHKDLAASSIKCGERGVVYLLRHRLKIRCLCLQGLGKIPLGMQVPCCGKPVSQGETPGGLRPDSKSMSRAPSQQSASTAGHMSESLCFPAQLSLQRMVAAPGDNRQSR